MNHQEHDKKAEESIIEKVAKYGWQITMIESDGYNPSFAYTIGLTETFNHPELMIFGLETNLMAELLNIAGDLIKKGKKIELEKNYNDFLENYNCQFIMVNQDYYNNYLGYLNWFSKGKNLKVLQLVWPNKNGDFPWNKKEDDDFDLRQPLLDRNMEFKFLEKPNLATFSTKPVVDKSLPIKEVYHNTDGEWQFLCGTTNRTEDCVLVSLKSIVKIDSSVKELFNLGYGESASRKGINHLWERKEKDDNT